MFDNLKKSVEKTGKPEWRRMLRYVAYLHEKCTHPQEEPFINPWEEIGIGYVYGPAFGHIDIVHQSLDVVRDEPAHALAQIENNLWLQSDDGLVPGAIWMKGKSMKEGADLSNYNVSDVNIIPGKASWETDKTIPPYWPVLIDEYIQIHGMPKRMMYYLDVLKKQIKWFERNRNAEDDGFFYLDIFGERWESGVDDGIRYIDSPKHPAACVDATSHMYMLYETAVRWSGKLGLPDNELDTKASKIKAFISDNLFSKRTGLFHDSWSVDNKDKQVKTFEGFWPVITGAATAEQAQIAITQNLMDPDKFFSPHPITTVSMDEPLFELRMWRGPVWNCITMWAVRGCIRYGFDKQAKLILENALDAISYQFDKTGTVWEYYHPFIDDQLGLARKPYTPYNTPCRDYLGHMPAIAMAQLWDRL